MLSGDHNNLSYVANFRNRKIHYFFSVILLLQFAVVPFFFHVDSVAKALLTSSLILLFLLLSDGAFFFNQRFLYFSTFFLLLLSVPSLSIMGWLQLVFLLLLIVYALFILSCNKTMRCFEIFLRFYTFFIVIASVLGLYEYFSSLFLGISKKMLIPYLLPPNLDTRVVGIFGQSNFFALLLLSGLLVFLYLHLHDDSFLPRRFKKLKYLPVFLVVLVFFLTGSRAGLLALTLTYLPLCWLIVRKRYLADNAIGRRQFIQISCVLILAFGLSSLLNLLAGSAPVRELGSTGISADARLLFWTSALLIFLDHPWFGVGLDNFRFYLPQYINQAHDTLGFVQYEAMGYTKWAHNEMLQLLCEGGIFAFTIIVLLLGYFFLQLILYATGHRQWSALKLYSHLFLLPFIVQSMFSWPMRHSAILILFFTFLGFLVSQYPVKALIVPVWGQLVFRFGSICGLLLLLSIGIQEVRMGSFVQNLDHRNIQASFPEFKQLVANSYAEYPLLSKIVPRYVYAAMKGNDIDLAEKMLPYVKKLVDLQGAHWQWYNLSIIYHLLQQEKEAKLAVEQAIHLYPTDQTYWSFLHYLNMLKASRDTGRPVEDFYPHPPGGHFILPEMFRVGH